MATKDGEQYLVSLAGESDWVRNLRAAGGKAIVRHGGRSEVRTQELPATERAPILQAYLSKRALSKSAAAAARDYFGLEAHPSLEALAKVASHYGSFKVNCVRSVLLHSRA